jgi:L-malate glycosyltransferase
MENVALLALAQREAGHCVEVAIDLKRHTTASEELAAPRLRALGLLSAQPWVLSSKSMPWEWFRDARTLKKRPWDVVHSHMSHDHWLARFALRKGTILVRSIHAERSLRRAIPQAHALTVPYEEALQGVRNRKAIFLPALTADEFKPPEDRAGLKRALGLGQGPVVGMISTFQASRRHAVALEAFAQVRARVSTAFLLLLGDGALQEEIRREAARLGLKDAVRFAGYRRGDDFVRHLQAMDEVWILGLGNDWSGRAAVQARHCGVRVLGVREGALTTLADVLCEPDATSVAEASLSGASSTKTWPTNPEIAERTLGLYRDVRSAQVASNGA